MSDRYIRDLQAHDSDPTDADGLPVDVAAQAKEAGTRRMPWSRVGAWVTGIINRIVPGLIRSEVPSWARAATPPQIHTAGGDLPALPEDGETYTLQGRDPTGASPAIRFWTHMGGRSLPVAETADVGDSDRPAREDHIHNLPLNAEHLDFDATGNLEIAQAFIEAHSASETQANRWETVQFQPNVVTDRMLDGELTFQVTAHLSTAFTPPGATHFRPFVGRARGASLAVSLITDRSRPHRSWIKPTASEITLDFSSALRESDRGLRRIAAGIEYLASDGTSLGMPAQAQLWLGVALESRWVRRQTVDARLPETTPGSGVALVQIFIRSGTVIDLLAERSFRVEISDTAATDGMELTLRVTQDSTGGHNIDFDAAIGTVTGVPSRSLNTNPGETTILRFVRWGGTWIYIGRGEQTAGGGGGSGGPAVDQTARDDATEALSAARDAATAAAAAADLRSRITRTATPVAADRFFFTDENITGDPLSYVDYRGLVRALIPDVAGLLIDDPASPMAASADTVDKVVYRGGRLYRTIHQHGVDPTVSYRSFATADLPGGYTWGGAHQIDPSPSSLAINTVIYSIPGAHFLRRVSLGGMAFWGGYNPANWRGAWGSESEADAHVQAVGDIVYYGGIVRVVTARTPRTPDAYHYQAIVQARTFTAKAATAAGTVRTWNYTLDAEDTELFIEVDVPVNGTSVYHSRVVPRATLSSSSKQVMVDSRVPGGLSMIPDGSSCGVTASISGNVLTLSTVGYAAGAAAPVVYSK